MIEGGMPFTATLENDTYLYNINILDNNDGTYTAQYAVSAPGDFDLALKLNDEYHIFGSPFAVRVTSGSAEPRKSRVRGEGLQHAKSMETSYFLIEAKDTLGNNKTTGGDPFEVSLSGPAVLKGLQDNNDGTYNCAFEVTATADTVAQVPNAVRLNVTLNGVHLPGSPFVPSLEAPDGSWEVVQQQQNGMPPPPESSVPSNPPTLGSGGFAPPLGPPPNNGVQPAFPDELFRQQQQQSMDQHQQMQFDQQQEQWMQASYTGSNMDNSGDNEGFNSSVLQPLAAPLSLPPGAGRSDSALFDSAIANTPISPSQSSGMSKLAMASARAKNARKARQQAAANGNQPNPEKVTNALNGTGGSSVEMSMSGADIPEAEQPIWEKALNLMRDPLILPLFEAHSSHLMLVFDSYSHGKSKAGAHPVKTLPLLGPTGTKKGAVQMSVDYDIVPSFLTKREVKGCYNVVTMMQQSSGPNGGLDFSGFIQLLGLLAVVSLSKPSFHHLYPSNNAKVGVLLEMWGFSDPIKLQMAQRGHN